MSAGTVLKKTGSFLRDYLDCWLLPAVLTVAWFYYPYCERGPSFCIWRAILHRQCPGCGLTRGICFLVHGRVVEAIRFNPLSAMALGLMALTFFKSLRGLLRAAQNSLARAPKLDPSLVEESHWSGS
jgi:hypothetical protein